MEESPSSAFHFDEGPIFSPLYLFFSLSSAPRPPFKCFKKKGSPQRKGGGGGKKLQPDEIVEEDSGAKGGH